MRSKTHRSMIVIKGQVSAPAVAALATSTPSRFPRSLEFQIGAGLDMVAGALVAGAVGGRGTE